MSLRFLFPSELQKLSVEFTHLKSDWIWRKSEEMKITLIVCVSMIHQEPQNGGLTARLSALPEDVGKSPARKRWGF